MSESFLRAAERRVHACSACHTHTQRDLLSLPEALVGCILVQLNALWLARGASTCHAFAALLLQTSMQRAQTILGLRLHTPTITTAQLAVLESDLAQITPAVLRSVLKPIIDLSELPLFFPSEAAAAGGRVVEETVGESWRYLSAPVLAKHFDDFLMPLLSSSTLLVKNQAAAIIVSLDKETLTAKVAQILPLLMLRPEEIDSYNFGPTYHALLACEKVEPAMLAAHASPIAAFARIPTPTDFRIADSMPYPQVQRHGLPDQARMVLSRLDETSLASFGLAKADMKRAEPEVHYCRLPGYVPEYETSVFWWYWIPGRDGFENGNMPIGDVPDGVVYELIENYPGS